MEPRIRRCLFLIATFFTFTFSGIAVGYDLGYKQRGAGSDLRHEGIKKEKKSGNLELISFSAPLRSQNRFDRIEIKFLSSSDKPAFLTVREINSRHGYRMDAQRSQWPPNSISKFSWPTADVLQQLELEPSALAYMISERKHGGSGLVYPAIIHSDQSAVDISSYLLIAKSKYSCAPLGWSLSQYLENKWKHFYRDSLKNAVAKKAHLIDLDFSGISEGWYKVDLSCERKGQGTAAGSDNKQSRYYIFFHRKRL